MRKVSFWLWVTLILYTSPDIGAQTHFQHFYQLTTEKGLANNIVNDIAQDNTGYIWIATQGGLQRYDGKGFISFRHNPLDSSTLPSDAVLRLLLDKADNLWVVTVKGIARYKPSSKKFVRVKIKDWENQFQSVTSFLQDTQGTIWIADEKAGLYFFDESFSVFRPYFEKWPTINAQINCIYEDKETKNFWLGTSEGFRLKESTRNIISDPFQAQKNKESIRNLHLDAGQRVLRGFSNEHSFSVLLNEHNLSIRQESNPPLKQVLSSRSGKILGVGGGVYLYNQTSRKWISYVSFNEMEFKFPDNSQSFNCIFEDRDGVIWIGSSSGILIFVPNSDKFKYYTFTSGINSQTKNESVVGLKGFVHEISDSLIALASWHNGLQSLTLVDKQWRRLSVSNKISDLIKECHYPLIIFTDSRGNTWLSCKTGQLIRWEMKSGVKEKINNAELAGFEIRSGAEDAGDNICWGTSQGTIIKWVRADNRFQRTVDLNFFKDYQGGAILNIFFDPMYNSMWLVTEKQFIRLNENNEAVFYSPNKDVAITDVKEWDKETWLVGTNQGIFLFNRMKPGFQELIIDGLPFKYHISSLAKDTFSNIWVGTQGNGLFKIINTQNKAIKFGRSDGLIFSSTFSGLTQLQSGWLATVVPEGFLQFDPASIANEQSSPQVEITSFSVNDSQINLDSISPEPIQLKWNQNTIAIEFSPLSYYYSGKVSYQYRLEGLEEVWSYSGEAEKIRYPELRPGAYTFRVRSQPLASEVISDEATIAFTIEVPFWKSWLFILACVSATFITIFYIYYAKIQRVLLIRKIRNQIARDLHDHIGSSLSSISILLNVVSASIANNTSAFNLLKKISETAHLTQENLYDIVWSINSKNSSMAHILARMQEFMHSIFEGQQVRLSFQADEAIQLDVLRLDKRYDLYLIFKEMINNGAKYAQASNVTIHILRKKNSVELIYQDDGIGFNEEDCRKEGNGIQNMRTRASALNGHLTITSALGKGTRIKLEFPISS